MLFRIWLFVLLGVMAGMTQPAFPPAFWAPASAPAAFVPTSISGMALYWNYNDLSQGSTISNWVDRINSVAAHQPDATKQPTNSTSGLWFTGGMRMTNLAFTVNASSIPFSVWISYKPNGTAAGFHCLVSDHPGNNGFFNNAALGIIYFNTIGQQNMYGIAGGTAYTFVYVENGSGTNGSAIGFTNGVSTASSSGSRQPAWTVNSIGSDNTSENFQGFIKFIGVWTNRLLTITDATNLYNYAQAH